MTRLIGSTTTALLLALALPAGAQTSGQSEESGQADQMAATGQRAADQLTCADIATMDTAVVPGTLYFIAGYQEGRGMGMGQREGDAEITGATGTAATAGAADQAGSGEAGATTGTDDGGATGLAGTGTAATGQDATGGSGSGAAAGGAPAQPRIAAVSGFFEIPVEQVMRVCAETPERSVSDVVREEGGRGSQSN
jgi:hypothetical protein